LHGPDGMDYPNKVIYIEVVKPERLVYDHGAIDGAIQTVNRLEEYLAGSIKRSAT
jgi:uncharacterized protein YndB with AHSA1/START domain